MTNLEKIYDFISKVNSGQDKDFLRKYKINGVGYGSKHVGGNDQTKASLIFYVNDKRAIDSLKVDEIIPQYIDVEGTRLETDVQLSQINNTLIQSCFPDNGTNFPLSANYKRRRPLQGGMSSIFGPGQTIDKAVWSINVDNTDATLGIIVRDKSDGSIVALSNNHVFAKSSKMPAQYFNWSTGTDMLEHNLNPNTNVTSLSVKNPGRKNGINASSVSISFNHKYNYPWDNVRGNPQLGYYGGTDGIQTGFRNRILSGGVYNPYATSDTQYGDVIGRTKRAVTFGEKTGGFVDSTQGSTVYGSAQGSVDAAIATLSSYDLIDSSVSNQIINFSEPGPYTFATKEEVLSLFEVGNVNYGAPVFRSGRRFGPVGNVNGSGQTVSCYMVDSASSLSATGKLSAYQYAPAHVSDGQSITYFPDSIWVRGDGTTKPGGGGDSGSAVFACLSSTVNSASAWKMIGLLYAGPSDQTSTIISPIFEIVNKLNIAPWDGTIPTLTATTDSFTLSDNIFSGESSTTYQSQSLTAGKYGQTYTLIETEVGDRKPTSSNPLGSNKLGPEPYQGQVSTWSEFKYSRPDGRVVVMSPKFYHHNLNINDHDIFNSPKIDFHTIESLTRAGGGIIYQPQDNGGLKAISRVNTPYLTASPYLANDIAQFNGKFYYNNTANIDYSIKAGYTHSVYGNLSSIAQGGSFSTGNVHFSASYLPGTDASGGGAPAGGWGKFRENSTPPSTNYAYDGLKSVATSPFRHQGLGDRSISDTDFLFSIHKPLKTTYGWASTGFSCSAVFETFEKFGDYQVWGNQNNSMHVPSSPTVDIPLPISDPINVEATKGGVMVFDDDMNFIQNITPRLTIDASHTGYPQGTQKKRTKKYLDTNGNTVTYEDNVILGSDTFVDAYTTMHYDDGLTTLSGGKLLAFTGKHYLNFAESGVQKNEYAYYVETYKYDESIKQFTFNQIVSAAMPCTWPHGGTANTVTSKLGRKTFNTDGGFFEPRINNINLIDDKLYVNLYYTGPYNLGMLHVFTKDNNDQFTMSHILSAPCLSGSGNGFDGIQSPLSSYQGNEKAFGQVQEFGDYIVASGYGAQYRGYYIEGAYPVGYVTNKQNIRNWDVTSPNAWPSFPMQPGLSARYYDLDPVWLINKDSHTLAGCLSTPLVEMHKSYNINDLNPLPNITNNDGLTSTNPTGNKKYSINYLTSDPNEIYLGPSDTQQQQLFVTTGVGSRTQIVRREAHASKDKLLVGYQQSTLFLSLSDLYATSLGAGGTTTDYFNSLNGLAGNLRGGNRSVTFIDMYENINGYPTLTKRLSTVYSLQRTYKETYAGTSDYYTDYDKGLNLGTSLMNGNTFDDTYFYYWTNGLVGQSKQGDDSYFEDGKAANLIQAGFGRIRLDDENYFKPIAAYDNLKRYDGGFNPRYNQDLSVPINSTAFGISGGPSEANTKYSWSMDYNEGYKMDTTGYYNSPE